MAGCGFCSSSQMRSLISALDVAGIGNLVGRNVTVSTGVMALVDGVKMLHCLQ